MVQIKDLTYRHTRKISMVFRMNKPIIKGTTKHSALLAKAEQVRTHGGDPSLVEASALYGASNSPNIIDYKIKQAKIKWDEGKKKDKKDSTETKTINTTTNTIINRKIETSDNDANKAKDILINNSKTKEIVPTPEVPTTEVPTPEEKVITNPESVIGYPHDYSNIDEMPIPKKETWRDRRRKRQEEKDLAKLDEFQANYPTEEIENEKIKDEQLDIDAFVPEEEQDDPDNFPKVILAHNDPRYKGHDEITPRYNEEGKLVGYDYPPEESKMRPGYHYVDGQFRYNNMVVHPAKVPIEVRNTLRNTQQKSQNEDDQLNRNQQMKVDEVEEKKVEEGKSQKTPTRKPREHEYKWGTTSTPGGWKPRGKEAYEKALAEWRSRNK